MIKNPFAGFDFSNPFGTDAMKRSRNLFGVHTTPRDWKHGARDIPFGLGAASLHVDGTDGDDSNDGESWITAKKTIQEAVDAADSWTQIFIKAGTYSEEVDIATARIALIGERRGATTISDASNVPLTITADKCYVEELTATSGAGTNTIAIDGDYTVVTRCNVTGSRMLMAGDYNEISHCIANSQGFYILGSHDLIHNCITDGSGQYGLLIRSGSMHNRIFDNNIWNATTRGIFLDDLAGTPSYNTIFHNNLVSNTVQVVDEGTNNKLFENHYSNHSNVDNGFGIAKAPYAYTGGTDPRPVVTRNGWLGLSWADADQVGDILADVTGIAGAAMRGTDNAALASVCTEARLAELDAANLPTDIDTLLARMCQHHGAAYAELETTANATTKDLYYTAIANGVAITSVPITITERCCIVVNAATLTLTAYAPTTIEIERPMGTIRTTQESEAVCNAMTIFHHAAWEVLDPGTYTYYLVNRLGSALQTYAAWIKAVASDCVGT